MLLECNVKAVSLLVSVTFEHMLLVMNSIYLSFALRSLKGNIDLNACDQSAL